MMIFDVSESRRVTLRVNIQDLLWFFIDLDLPERKFQELLPKMQFISYSYDYDLGLLIMIILIAGI